MIRFKELLVIILFLSIQISTFSNLLSKNSDTCDIILYEYKEAFFSIPFRIDTVRAGNEFLFQQNSGQTKCIYFDHGPFQCFFFSQSGHSYSVKLPDEYLIDADWENDPFHTPARIHVHTLLQPNPGKVIELNDAIRDFDEEYEPFLAHLTQSYYNPDIAEALLDSFTQVNFQDKSVSDSAYYAAYKKYKKGILEFHLKHHNLDTIINHYLLEAPVMYHVPSYRTLFSLVLGDYFDYLKRKETFDKVYSEFSKLSPVTIRSYLQADPLLRNDTILEAILLKECHNAFYRKAIREELLIAFTDSLKASATIEISRVTADKLKQQFTWLRNGYSVPEFQVSDLNGRELILGRFQEKMIFFGFCDLDNMQCLRELEHLKYLQAKFDKFFESIIVLKYSSPKQLNDFLKNIPSSLQVVTWDDYPHLAKIYEVKALPVFYLIDPDGKMMRNPAPYPSDNFEYELFKILRARGDV